MRFMPANLCRRFLGIRGDMKEACLRVWVEGDPQSVVAEELGMSRWALARKLARVKAVSVRYAESA